MNTWDGRLACPARMKSWVTRPAQARRLSHVSIRLGRDGQLSNAAILLHCQQRTSSNSTRVCADRAGARVLAVGEARNARSIGDCRNAGRRRTPVTIQRYVLRAAVAERAGCDE